MEKINVMVLYGGCSMEHEVSKETAATIIASLSPERYNIIPVYITPEGKWLLYDGPTDNIRNIRWEKFGATAVLSPDRSHRSLLRIVGNRVKPIPVDIVFPALHGTNGEDGTIQGLLELAGIPYVGCGVRTSALAMDKELTKIIAGTLGLRQAEYLVFRREELENAEEVYKKIRYKLGYPCFIKPANTGSSVGISKVRNKKALTEALALAARYDQMIIAEKAVKGRELECSVLGAGGEDTETSVVGEVFAAGEFYDYDSKYINPDSYTVVPADIPAEVSDEIRRISAGIFNILDGFGLARVDFFLEKGNKVVFNEINTMPGFTAISMYAKLWMESKLDMPQLLDRLIDMGLKRYGWGVSGPQEEEETGEAPVNQAVPEKQETEQEG